MISGNTPDQNKEMIQTLARSYEKRGEKISERELCERFKLDYDETFAETKADEPSKPDGDVSDPEDAVAEASSDSGSDAEPDAKPEPDADDERPEVEESNEAPGGSGDPPVLQNQKVINRPDPKDTPSKAYERISEQIADRRPDVVKDEAENPFRNLAKTGAVGGPPLSKDVEDPDYMELLGDITKLEVHDNTLRKLSVLQEGGGPKATEVVVCLSSAYTANISSMTLADKSALRNTTATNYEATRKLYEIIYNRIESSVPAKPPFKKWMEMTALSDLDVLVYGLYAASYKGENEFTVTCQSCKHENKVNLPPSSLIQVKDDAVHNRIVEVTRHNDASEIANETQIGKVRRILLKKSGMVMDIVTPSFVDHLNLISKEPRQEMADIYQYMLFTKSLYLLDKVASKEAGKPIFVQYSSPQEILNILSSRIHDEGDEKHIREEVSSQMDKYTVEFQIPEFQCAGVSCGKSIGPVEVDLRQVLFTRLVSR